MFPRSVSGRRDMWCAHTHIIGLSTPVPLRYHPHPVDLNNNFDNTVIASKQKIWEQQGTDIYFIRLELRFLTLVAVLTEKAPSPLGITPPTSVCRTSRKQYSIIQFVSFCKLPFESF